MGEGIQLHAAVSTAMFSGHRKTPCSLSFSLQEKVAHKAGKYIIVYSIAN